MFGARDRLKLRGCWLPAQRVPARKWWVTRSRKNYDAMGRLAAGETMDAGMKGMGMHGKGACHTGIKCPMAG